MEIDTTKPHVGRIYDYVLGGHHNHPIDREAAEGIVKIVPTYPKLAKLNRWFLQLVGSRWAEEGVERVLDLGSGLPTQGHLNDDLSDARILFSDFDSLSVVYGQQILADNPNMRYVHADVRMPAPLLEEAAKFFGAERKIDVSCIGLLYFLADEDARSLVQQLHAFCAPGSALAVTFGATKDGDAVNQAEGFSKLAGIKIIPRTPDEMRALLSPWQVEEIKPICEWLDIEDMISPEEYAVTPVQMWALLARY
jgi:O-methyltransferase involved in polyketide biosynthesis